MLYVALFKALRDLKKFFFSNVFLAIESNLTRKILECLKLLIFLYKNGPTDHFNLHAPGCSSLREKRFGVTGRVFYSRPIHLLVITP